MRVPRGGSAPIFFSRHRKENGRGRSKEKMPAAKRPVRGLFAEARGSSESACPESEAPSTLRRTCSAKGCDPASDGAAGGRGARPHLPLLLFPRVTRWPGDRSALVGRKLQALSIAGAAPGEAEGAGIEIRRFRSPPPSTPAVVMRVQGSSSSGAGRRDDGAIDTRRTDSPDPRAHEKAGRLFVSGVFFSTAPAATFLWQDKEKWGPESPGNLPPPSRRAAAQI